MAGRPHPDSVKAAVVAALLAGQGVMELSKQYELPKQTVSVWKRDAIGLLGQKKDLCDQINDLLGALLDGAQAGISQLHNEQWRTRQSAAELGTFVGIIVDKAVRILDAAERARQQGAGE